MTMLTSKKLEVNDIDKRFRLWLLGTTLLFGVIRAVLPEENVWIHSIFIILMAGMVGYFTNYLAIRMLFQPKQGKVLGWEGLVPKNKPEIARSLAESVQTRLLSPDVILEYIQENQIIETGTQRLSEWVDRILNEERVRAQITERLVGLLKTHGDELMEMLFKHSQSIVKDMAADPDRVREQWHVLRGKLAEYLNNQDNREQITEVVRKLFLEEVPRLAELIDAAMVAYLKERETMGTIGMGIKRVFSIDSEAIKTALERFATDPESGDMLVRVMDTLAEELLLKLNSEETQQVVVTKVSEWVDALADYSNTHLLPLSVKRLQAYLHDEASWAQIDSIVLKAIEALKNTVIEMLATDKGTEFIKEQLSRVVQRLNVTTLVEDQVMKLDTDELEDMILNNTGGNLVVIQILGGMLGLIAGTVQVDIRFAVPLLGIMGVVYVAFMFNERRHRS